LLISNSIPLVESFPLLNLITSSFIFYFIKFYFLGFFGVVSSFSSWVKVKFVQSY